MFIGELPTEQTLYTLYSIQTSALLCELLKHCQLESAAALYIRLTWIFWRLVQKSMGMILLFRLSQASSNMKDMMSK